MASSRFQFLEVAWEDLYESISKVEKSVEEGSYSVYKNLKAFAILLARKVLSLEDIEYEKGSELQALKTCTYIDEKTINLLDEIMKMDFQEFEEIYLNEVMNELFVAVMNITINYGAYDYNNYDFSYLSYNDVNVAYDLLLNKTLLKDESTRKLSEIEDIENPFELVGFEQLIDEKIKEFSLLDKDVFETYEEYCHRIASMDLREVGEVYIEIGKYDNLSGTLPVVGAVFTLDGINKFQSEIFYIKSDNIKFKIKEPKLQIPLLGKLCVHNNEIYMDITKLYVSINDNLEKVEVLMTQKVPYESEIEFYNRIDDMPDFKVGKLKLLRDRYSLEKESMPCKIAFYRWVEGVSTEEGHVKINRLDAKAICDDTLMYDVYGKFIGIGEEAYLHKLSIKVNNKEFEIENITLREIEAKKRKDEYIRKLFEKAEAGDADVMNEIGELYTEGEKIEKNYEKALHWFKKAAELGHGNAVNNIGEMYYYGNGVEKNLNEAVKWYYIGAEQGNADALYNLGNMYEFGEGLEQNYEEAVKRYTEAANKGNPYAQYNLGDMYECGQGVKQNYEEAVKWYTLAAEQGESDAQLDLGNMYFYGQGVDQDYDKALMWYLKSANQGNVNAQYNLGDMYFYGKGVEKNYEESEKWNALAKENDEKVNKSKNRKTISRDDDGKLSEIYGKVKEGSSGIFKSLKSSVLDKFLN